MYIQTTKLIFKNVPIIYRCPLYHALQNNMVTVRVQLPIKNNLKIGFLQIKLGRIHNILWAFLIKQCYYSTHALGYEMIIANSYPTCTREITVNYTM